MIKSVQALNRLSSTLVGIELESRYNKYLVTHPNVRNGIFGRGLGSDRHQLEDRATRRLLLPNIHHRAGMGHRVSSWIAAFLVAQAYDLELLRVPWRDSWDSWLGLDAEQLWQPGHSKMIFLPPVGRQKDQAGEALFQESLAAVVSEPIVYRLPLDHGAWDQSGAFEEMGRRYWGRHERRPTGNCLRVSVHVRRGDVTDNMSQRFRGISYFERQLSALRDVLHEMSVPWQGVVHTQAGEDEMRDLLGSGVELGRCKTELEDFDAMCQSDVLIASPSSFSVTAGMISGNVVIRPRNWFHAMPDDDRWVAAEDDGAVDGESLRQAVERISAQSR